MSHSYPDSYGSASWEMTGFDPDHTFLCFAPGQDEAVYEAVRLLSMAGFLTLPAVVKGGVRAGNPAAVDEYIKDAAAFVLFLGAEAVRDEDVRRRWGQAKAEADRRQMPVLVFKLDNTPLPADWPKVPVRSTIAAPGKGLPPRVGELVTRLREALGLVEPSSAPPAPVALPAAPPPGLAPVSAAAPPPKPAAAPAKPAAPLPPKKKPVKPPAAVPPGERFAFISYSHSHEKEVSRIVGKLEERGVRYWFDRGIRTSDDWMEKIQVKLRASSALLLVVSEKSMASRYVLRETQSAIRRNIEHGFPIVVFRLDDAVFPDQVDFLNTIQAVNHADTAHWPRHLDRLADELKAALEHTEAAPGGGGKMSAPSKPGLADRLFDWVRKNTLPAAALAGLAVFAVLAAVMALSRGSSTPPTTGPTVALADEAETAFGQPVVLRVLDNDTPAGTSKTLAGVSPAYNGQAAANPDGTVTYTPNPGFSGDDGFEYRVAGASAPGRVRVRVLPFAGNPDRRPFTDGVIEVSASGVRAVGFARSRPVGGGGLRLSFADRATARDLIGKAGLEAADRLVYEPKERAFSTTSQNAVRAAIGRLQKWLTDDHAVPADQVLVVISSGAVVELTDRRAEEFRAGLEELVGQKQVHLVDELTEAKMVYTRAVPAEFRSDGETVAVDIGSGNVKAAYYSDGEKVWRGVFEKVPGTARLAEKAGTDLGTEAARRAAAAAVRAEARTAVMQPLQTATQRVSMLQRSKRVYLIGGAAWAVCRVARPDISVEARVAPLMFPADVLRYRERVAAAGPDVFADAPATGPTAAAFNALLDRRPAAEAAARKADLGRLRRQSDAQLIAAGEVVGAVADGLGFAAAGREVYFVNDAQYDWLTEYLETQLNRPPGSPK